MTLNKVKSLICDCDIICLVKKLSLKPSLKLSFKLSLKPKLIWTLV